MTRVRAFRVPHRERFKMVLRAHSPIRTIAYLRLAELILRLARWSVKQGVLPPKFLYLAFRGASAASRSAMRHWRQSRDDRTP